MKRIWLVLLICVLLLTACGKSEAKVETTPAAENQTALPPDPGPVETEEVPAPEAEFPIQEILSEDAFEIVDLGDGTCELANCSVDAKEIVVPETLQGRKVIGIKHNCFFKCSTTEKIVLPDTVEYLETMAFYGAENMREVVLGSGLRRVGVQAFNYCKQLTSITFPEGVETFDGIPFFGCKNLKEVYIPASATNFPEPLGDPDTCYEIVIITPAGSAAEAEALKDGFTVRNP